jgi:hypothetical protein
VIDSRRFAMDERWHEAWSSKQDNDPLDLSRLTDEEVKAFHIALLACEKGHLDEADVPIGPDVLVCAYPSTQARETAREAAQEARTSTRPVDDYPVADEAWTYLVDATDADGPRGPVYEQLAYFATDVASDGGILEKMPPRDGTDRPSSGDGSA